MNNHPVYLPIKVKNAEKDQDRIFPEIKNIDLQNIQKMVSKPVIVFDTDQKILIQVSPNDIFKVGIDTDWEIISTLLHDLDLTIPGVIQNGDMVITAFGKTQRQLNQAFSNITNLFSTKTTSDLAEGSNQYFTQARARSAAVQNSINPSETQRAPSQRAVHLALEVLQTTLEDLISQENTARISDIQDILDQINSLLDSLNTEIQNRLNGDQILADSIQDEAQQRILSINNLQSQIDSLHTPFEVILSNNNTFIFTVENVFILVPGLEVEVERGRYYVEYTYYGRSSINNRNHTHRITVNDIFIPGSGDGYLIRSNQFHNHFYKQIVNVEDSGILKIEARRSGGNGNYESYEKKLLIRRIGDI